MKKNLLLDVMLFPACITSIFGAGYSGFIFSAEESARVETELKVASVEGGASVDAFGSVTLTAFKFYSGGFELANGSYATSGGLLTGSSTINPSVAKSAISSLNSSKMMKIVASFSGDNNGIDYAMDNSSSAVTGSSQTLSGSGITLNSSSISNGSTIDATFNITLSDTTLTSVAFTFSISLSPSSYSNFYNVYSQSTYGFKVTLSAGEADA